MATALRCTCGKRPASPFFDAEGRRLQAPEVLSAKERAALDANPG